MTRSARIAVRTLGYLAILAALLLVHVMPDRAATAFVYQAF